MVTLEHDLNATMTPAIDPKAFHKVFKVACMKRVEDEWSARMEVIVCTNVMTLCICKKCTIQHQMHKSFLVLMNDTLINPGTNHKAGVVIYINQWDESKHEGNVQLFMD